VLKINGQTWCQAKAINKFLAKRAGLLGQTNLEELQIEMLMETKREFIDKDAVF